MDSTSRRDFVKVSFGVTHGGVFHTGSESLPIGFHLWLTPPTDAQRFSGALRIVTEGGMCCGDASQQLLC